MLAEINKQSGVSVHRPAVLRACLKALQTCESDGGNLLDAAVKMREQNRLIGRPLPKRAVGSTLLLKGLEFEAAVILNASDLNARHLYVAMTRGSKDTHCLRAYTCANSKVVRMIALGVSMRPLWGEPRGCPYD